MDQVMKALYEVFPDILVQFEDFQSDRVRELLSVCAGVILTHVVLKTSGFWTPREIPT
jgi:hypothetical protein